MPKNRGKGDENEPRREDQSGHRYTGASYGATEREQTEDLRSRSPSGDADVADGGVSEELEQDSDNPPD